MPDYNIEVKIDPRNAVSGTRAVEKGMDRLVNKSDQLRRSVSNALKFVGVGVLVRELTQIADTFTNIQNRIRVVTNSYEELNAVSRDLFQISQATRSSYQATTELFSRLALSTRELGVTQSQLITFTKSLNQAIIQSGASGQEAEAGLIQFSQGLASGALRGDELRSVLEQLPVVADVIAKELDADRGELKDLGEQGDITAKVILEAFKNAEASIERGFGKTLPTLSQSFTVLRNAVVRFVGEIDTSTGITGRLAQLIISLANNIETLSKVLIAGASTWAIYRAAIAAVPFIQAISEAARYAQVITTGQAVAIGSATAEAQKTAAVVAGIRAQVAATEATLARTRAEVQNALVVRGSATAEFARLAVLKQIGILEGQLATQRTALAAATQAQAAANVRAAGTLNRLKETFPAVTAAVNRLTAALAANPLGAIAIALTGVIALLVVFSDDIKLSQDRLATLADVGTAVWNRLSDGIRGFLGFVRREFGPLFDVIEEFFGDIEINISDLILLVASRVDLFIGIWTIAFKTVIAVWKNLPDVFAEIFTLAFNRAVALVERGTNEIIGQLRDFFNLIGVGVELVDITFDRLENRAQGASLNLGKIIGEAVQQGIGFSGVTEFVTGIFDEAEQIAVERERSSARAEAERQRREAERVRQAAATEATKQAAAFQEIVDNLKTETELLKLSNTEREVQKALLQAEKQLKRELTATEEGLIESLVRENQTVQNQVAIYDQIKGPLEEYKNTISSLNALIEQGAISQNEYNQALSQVSLVSGVEGIRSELGGEGGQTAQLQAQLLERQTIIDQALEARLISEQEYLNLSLEINRAYSEQIATIERERFATQLRAGQTAFAALATASKGYAGEQSAVYRGLFAASKSFAAAEATVAILQGIANAAKLGWPQNIPAIANTIAQTAGLVAQIQGVSSSGFQSGGNFRVGGSGGADSQLVQFRATPNETVSIRTPGQERAMARQEMATQQETPQFNVTNVNVVDQNLLDDYLASPGGGRVFINYIQKYKSQINGVLGPRR